MPSPRSCGIAGSWAQPTDLVWRLAVAPKADEEFPHTECQCGEPSSVFEATACSVLLIPCGSDDPREKAGGESEAALKECKERAGEDGSCVVTEFSKLTHESILRGDVPAGPVVAAEVAKAAAHMPRSFTRYQLRAIRSGHPEGWAAQRPGKWYLTRVAKPCVAHFRTPAARGLSLAVRTADKVQ